MKPIQIFFLFFLFISSSLFSQSGTIRIVKPVTESTLSADPLLRSNAQKMGAGIIKAPSGRGKWMWSRKFPFIVKRKAGTGCMMVRFL